MAYYDGIGAERVSCWGFVSGYKNLLAIDFDWAWVYRLWKAMFGPRAETLTIETPNGGLRPHFLCEKPETNDKFKGTLHVELKGEGRFVVYEGKASKEDGSVGDYRVNLQKPIREDNIIVADTLDWLEETQKRYRFLQWSCLRSHLSKKRPEDPSHSIRLFLADVMVSDGFGDDEIFELFRDFRDFDYAKTRYQIEYTRKRADAGLKPPTCETLRETLRWNEENCQGCLRKGTAKHEKGIPLGEYRLENEGLNAIVYDEGGQPVWSAKASSLTGYNVKKDLAKKLRLDESVVDRAVAQLVVSLRRQEEDQKVEQTEEKLKEIDTTLSKEELERRAVELLDSVSLLYKLKAIYDQGVMVDRYRFVLGEDDKKLLTFLISVSAETLWSQSLWLTGTSGFGKTNLVVVTLELMPPGFAKTRSYLTGGGVRYGSTDYKVLFVREWRQFAEQDVRLMSREDGSYEYEIAVKDRETGEWTTQVGEIPAKTIITTSAERLPSIQMLRRCWLLSVDETPELTKLINVRKAEYRAGKVQPANPDDVAVIQHAVTLLKPNDVIVPYAEFLVDLAPWDRTRLDYFLDTIAIIAWLHQHQRAKDGQGRIVATPADLYMAMRICWKTLIESLLNLPERLRKCWKTLPSNLNVLGATTKDTALSLSVSQGTVRGYLADLVNLGYAVSGKEPGHREKFYWQVTPQTGSAESAESAFSACNWQEIAESVENALKPGSREDVQNPEGGLEGFMVSDPITGGEKRLTSPNNSAHVSEEAKSSSVGWEDVDLGLEHVLHSNSTLQREGKTLDNRPFAIGQTKLHEGNQPSISKDPLLPCTICGHPILEHEPWTYENGVPIHLGHKKRGSSQT